MCPFFIQNIRLIVKYANQTLYFNTFLSQQYVIAKFNPNSINLYLKPTVSFVEIFHTTVMWLLFSNFRVHQILFLGSNICNYISLFWIGWIWFFVLKFLVYTQVRKWDQFSYLACLHKTLFYYSIHNNFSVSL